MSEPVDENVEAERLRHVRALIEDVLREHDVCANVVLAGRAGRFEAFSYLAATWSNLRLEVQPDGSEFMGLRSRKADYVGRADEQRDHLAWSVGVVSGVAQMVGRMSLQWLEAAARFDKLTNATHTPWRRDDPRAERPG
jgi:hypothetical protein